MKNSRYLFLLSLVTLFALTNCLWTRTLTSAEQLTKALQENNKKVWLVYEGDDDNEIIEDVAQVFRGMIQVAVLESEASGNHLVLYQDNRQEPSIFKENFTTENIVSFVLQNLDQVIAARSKVAQALKANQQYQKREAQRAKKEYQEEQALRKKSDTIILDAKNWNSFVNGRQAWVINFYEANCSSCIQLNKEWELIATAYKGKVKVAKINMTEPENEFLQEQIQLSKYPSIRFYKNGPKKVSEFAEFEGVHKRFSIQEWLSSKLEEKTTQVDISTLNKKNYETLCKSTKNTCIIVFLENDDSSTLSKLQGLSVKHLKKPITFLISQKGQQDAFAKQVGVSSYPDTVMVYCKQKKLWRMGGLDFQAIDEAIGEISLGNRNNFVKYSFGEPNLK